MHSFSRKRPRSEDDTDIQRQMQPPALPTTPSERAAYVTALADLPMRVGETWYVVAKPWWDWWTWWTASREGREGKDGEEVRALDNSTVVDESGELDPARLELAGAVYVPQDAWSALVLWYGPPTHTLPRAVIPRGISNQPSLELFPPRLIALRLSAATITSTSATKPPHITISIKDSTRALAAALAEAAASDPSAATSSTPAYRIWKLPPPSNPSTYPAPLLHPSILQSLGAELLELSEQTLEDALVESGDAFGVEFQSDGNWIYDQTIAEEGSGALSGATGEREEKEEGGGKELTPLFNSDDDFFTRLGNKLQILPPSAPPPPPTKAKPTLALVPASSKQTRAQSGQEPGTIGLTNLGNTCFMNAAVQCLAHTKELADYFLSGVYQDELNPDNPLGMHGAIAEAFGDLLHRIWSIPGSSTTSNSISSSAFSSTTASSYAPRPFKSQLQRFAPQFSGYQQHDSQELVAFLLDGLHEDLNRVLVKPYVVSEEWEDVDEKEGEGSTGGMTQADSEKEKQRQRRIDIHLTRFARTAWEGYKRRNDSVIVDLFQGQYMSRVVCPECQKVSITFDPFMYLTLPLPVNKKWRHTVYFVPWGEGQHVRVPVEIGRDASFRDLRNLLGRWMGVPAENLLTLEIFSSRFYRNLDNSVLCGEMADNDVIVCFELPCPSRQSRVGNTHAADTQAGNNSGDTDDGEPFIVPVYLCDAPSPSSTTTTSFSYSRGPTLWGYPFVVAVTREEAKSTRKMYDVIVKALERWTANARFLYSWEGTPSGAGSRAEGHVDIDVDGIEEDDIADRIHVLTHDSFSSSFSSPSPSTSPSSHLPSHSPSSLNLSLSHSSSSPHSAPEPGADSAPHKIGTKKDIFDLRLQINHKDFGAGTGNFGPNTQRFEKWETRAREVRGDDDIMEGDDDNDGKISMVDDIRADTPLLRDGDAFFCFFDENMKAYYFGDESSRWEYALWPHWGEFIHPELSASTSNIKFNQGITLDDCLAEFTKEEQLGEDDLWYCPRCKKHQQATKKFDLWKAPDILVVHLKRFSNSRNMRDKIDTFVDFPIEGLDLSSLVGEQVVGSRLADLGLSYEELAELGLGDAREPMVYDLFAVDEHSGGLVAGHYRACAFNHVTGKWYWFEDSYVTKADVKDAVNANAYLLFYRRRTSRPLGGQSHEKIEQARLNKAFLPPDPSSLNPSATISLFTSISLSTSLSSTSDPPSSPIQLPTPPSDFSPSPSLPSSALPFTSSAHTITPHPTYAFRKLSHTSIGSTESGTGTGTGWLTPLSTTPGEGSVVEDGDGDVDAGLSLEGRGGNGGDEDELPDFESSQYDGLVLSSVDTGPLGLGVGLRTKFDFPDPSSRGVEPSSPTSSNEAEVDFDEYVRSPEEGEGDEREFAEGIDEAGNRLTRGTGGTRWKRTVGLPSPSADGKSSVWEDADMQEVGL